MKKQTKLGLVLAAAAVISVSVASLVSARGWVQNGADWYYVDNNNEYVTDTIQSSGNAKFYLGEDGRMERDYFLEGYGDNDNIYYFGSNGAMVTNTWVAIESSRVDNVDDYIPDNFWYYFQASGKAMKASDQSVKKTTIDGKKYAFNDHGHMLTGWFDENGRVINPDDNANPFVDATYYAGGDNDGVLRTGWVTYYDGYDGDGSNHEEEYTNLYFYFNTSNNKKYGNNVYETKKINGRTYAFSSEGVMLSGWDPHKAKQNFSSISDKTTYFSGEDDGHQVKKGWVYAVPSADIDQKKYDDDEEIYMYFQSSGNIVNDQFKKINGKYYAFNRTGRMMTGVIVWSPAGIPKTLKAATDTDPAVVVYYHYIDKLDMDYAEGAMVAKKGILQTDSNEYIKLDANGMILDIDDTQGFVKTDLVNQYVKLHYFGEDGARRTGTNTIEFADDSYTFQTNAQGDKGSGTFSKKYYSLGILCKASSDIRYGIYSLATPSATNYRGPLQAQAASATDKEHWRNNLFQDNYEVLTTSGQRQKGNNASKKDADGNYWLISADNHRLKGIWTVEVKNNHSFKADTWYTRTINIEADQKDTLLDRDGKARKDVSYRELVNFGLAVANGSDILQGTGYTWTAGIGDKNANGTYPVWFTLNVAYNGTVYKTDYRDKSNFWVPMGILDNSNKTVTTNYTTCTDEAAYAYCVTPNDDYFLNCYWYSGNNPI